MRFSTFTVLAPGVMALGMALSSGTALAAGPDAGSASPKCPHPPVRTMCGREGGAEVPVLGNQAIWIHLYEPSIHVYGAS